MTLMSSNSHLMTLSQLCTKSISKFNRYPMLISNTCIE